MEGLPPAFTQATRAWLASRFPAPTDVQSRGWPLLAAGRHALLVAPTGSGKTLAAFLAAIDRLGRLPEDAEPGVRVLYVSPLKALVYDIERNLRAPLEGIAAEAEREGAAASFRVPRVAVRTGDTTPHERRVQARRPSEILVTTPESLYLILGSQARETLRTVETIIVDEIHALAPTKRGVHLALSLERVARRCTQGDPQRIGLSATARPTDAIARYLGGDRAVEIVDASGPPRLDLAVSVPVPDMTRPLEGLDEADPDAPPSLWTAIEPALLERIRASRSAIVFVNSRGLCERLAHRLNELAGEPLVRAHHGSLSHEKRREIEAALAAGELRGIVATSSLELGIDMESVDRVLLVESPGAVARGLQRIGRAGHAVGRTSEGVVFPKHRADLLEAVVVARGMRAGEVEPITVPRNALDVLAQQIVALAAEDGPIEVAAIEAMLARTASHAGLPRRLLDAVLDMLAGRYPSTDFAELRPRIVWDRERDRIEARAGAGRIALVSGGTIPDRGQYAVHLGEDGPRLGELDEEMVHESKPGDVVTLGASSWRILEITRDRVIVAPAPGEAGRLPFWRGDGPGRPIELGRALGRFVRELSEQSSSQSPELVRRWLVEEEGLDEYAAGNLVDYVEAQRAWTGSLPTDRRITIERFRDELGDWRVCILSPFGSRLHAPWALAIASLLEEKGGFDAQPLWTDDGIMFRFADADRLPDTSIFLPEPGEVEARVADAVGDSALFAAQFRENAARALLLPRRRPGARTPLWTQRLRAQNLHAVARRFPDFPIMLETHRACLQDVFDVSGLVELMDAVRAGRVGIDDVETPSASPFARSLAFAYTATYLYQLDLPVAERRSQALMLDRHLLRELLGAVALRELLDVDVIDRVEAQLQGVDPERQARHADALHDLLRRVGDLSRSELARRFEGDAATLDRLLEELVATRRAAVVRIADEPRWVAAEDAGLLRDGLGIAPAPDLPQAFLEAPALPLEQLLVRFARTHGPFTTAAVSGRLGLAVAALEPILASLAARDRLVSGELDPRGTTREWCDPDVLRRIKRETLEALREEIEPVPDEVFARFLIEWHGVGDAGARGAGAQSRRAGQPGPGAETGGEGSPGPGAEAMLERALDRLEGWPVSFAELERSILPARVPRHAPGMLDALGAQGRLVWIGRRAIGEKDGRVVLYRREHVAALHDASSTIAGAVEDDGSVRDESAGADDETSLVGRAILDHLATRGASFLPELVGAIDVEGSETVIAALWELVWQGLVTNDTFGPLRELGRRAAPSRRRPAVRRRATASAGRWSLVAPLVAARPSDTERLHARALRVLERHGIVSREVLAAETESGHLAALRKVLREMEEAGRVRRGHFVAGLTGVQLALPGVVDRLRALRTPPATPQAVLLAASDPAQPWGAVLPWPATRADGRPQRRVGASVVLVDGRPVLFVDRAGDRVLCFESDESEAGRARVESAARVLARGLGRLGRRRLEVVEIDGEPATRSVLAPCFERAGFRRAYRGLEVERASDSLGDA
ncbi:MAG: DEAD/DEAH box helicase [Myxococcota bacterium]